MLAASIREGVLLLFPASVVIITVFTTAFTVAFAADSSIQPMTDDQITQSWHQANPGAQTPELVPDHDETKVEWKGAITPDLHINHARSSNGSYGTSMKNGIFRKTNIQNEVRSSSDETSSTYYQFDLTESDDTTVLSQNTYQINSLQLGHISESYSLIAGDIMPNFSNLSSSFGSKGLIAQKSVGSFNLNGYAGTVAESWEALTGKVKRNSLLRDTFGVKIEASPIERFRFFQTAQAAADRSGTVTNTALATSTLSEKLHSFSTGFQFTENEFLTLNGEWATSGYTKDTQGSHTGQAYVIDGTIHESSALSSRVGYHNIDPTYQSLSFSAIAGVKEVYLGTNWNTTDWLGFDLDLRNSKQSYFTQTIANTDTNSGTLQANISAARLISGLNLNLQHSQSKTESTANTNFKNQLTSSSLNYSANTWTGGAGYSYTEILNDNDKTADSNTKNWNLSLGKLISNTDVESTLPPEWSLSPALSTTFQTQELTSGSKVENINYSFSVTAQKIEWGNLSFSIDESTMHRPYSQSDLKSRGLQVEAAHSFSKQSSAKLYFKNNHRNIDDPTLASEEQTSGMQYSYVF